MTEREQLIQLCSKLGAPTSAAAATMADQLIKRCDQLAAQRGIARTEAMAYLLQLVTKGSQGETPPGFEGVKKA
ncbi:hypothetical protein [Rariglobus hedericola]|uniref:ANTAR domain-containing protein n=1 Tax=Rariglobus hedericola TaxID=2597822 RepID=A0A556QGJ9_9BACT|nr:hypothetical protein [Rariglobus hedericola]TSJ75765.1 hypothetical protein FPL22_15985 [Rariglobus hedericola]